MLKWRYEETGPKLQQLKKKIQQLSEKMNQEADILKQYRESYEKLVNFKGKGNDLLRIWGLQISILDSLVDE